MFTIQVSFAQKIGHLTEDGYVFAAESLYYPEEHEITCIATCKDVWQMRIFGPEIQSFITFMNTLKPRQARKVKITSFTKIAPPGGTTSAQTLIVAVYPEEVCGCKDQ